MIYLFSGGKVAIGEPMDLVDAIREALKDKIPLPKVKDENIDKKKEINIKKEPNFKREEPFKKEETVKTEESKDKVKEAKDNGKESQQNVEEVELSKKSKRGKV